MAAFNYLQVLDMLGDDLAQMEQILRKTLASNHPYLEKLFTHILNSPGKRLRPALLLLCSKMIGLKGIRPVTYAAVFEMIHTATLIHDDVIDDSETRRGQETIYHGEGIILSVLFGDLLYTKANTLAISAGSLEVMGLISSVTEEMIEGEILQEKFNFDMNITEEDYFKILSRKTAFLFGGTAKAAGMASELPSSDSDALYSYGYNLGISFQLVDDFLDYTGNQSQMGKPVLSDLLAGKLTLPVIRFLKTKPQRTRDLITNIWEKQDASSLSELAQLIQESPSFQETRDLSREYAEKAISHLESFPDNSYRSILKSIPIEMLNRQN